MSCMSSLLSVARETARHDTGMALLSWFTGEETGSEGDGVINELRSDVCFYVYILTICWFNIKVFTYIIAICASG